MGGGIKYTQAWAQLLCPISERKSIQVGRHDNVSKQQIDIVSPLEQFQRGACARHRDHPIVKAKKARLSELQRAAFVIDDQNSCGVVTARSSGHVSTIPRAYDARRALQRPLATARILTSLIVV